MKVSYQWLSELVDLKDISPVKLAEILTSRGLEVEDIQDLSAGLSGVISVKIISRDKHPQADRLSLCKVDLGDGQALDIVCGAQNMKAGDIVALAQIGAKLPNGLQIQKSEIRGVTSNGMLCSEEELGLKEKSEGILILEPDTKLGQPLAQVLGRNDTILTLKLTANRGDCMSHYGLAREIGGALNRKPSELEGAKLPKSGSHIKINLDAGSEAPVFLGCMIEGVKIGPSPKSVQERLERLGSRSINNIVDATNLVLFELGHPVHAYDADKIAGQAIGVRHARAQEKLPLLDGSEITLEGEELVIFDGSGKAIGLAGVMGGGNSEVSERTTKLYLECAEFSPTKVRRAAHRFARRTEAAMRFEKGLDPKSAERAMARLVYWVETLSSGRATGYDHAFAESRRHGAAMEKMIRVPAKYFANFLGMGISDQEAAQILKSLDCEVKDLGETLAVSPPSYRLDLNIKEDLAEEIARHLGYDKIPSTIPVLTGAPRPLSEQKSAQDFIVLNRAKDELQRCGFQETLNYSFTSRAYLNALGFESSLKVLNPISEEMEWMVPSLLPGLVQNAEQNWNHHFGSQKLSLKIFEIRPTFSGGAAIVDPKMHTGMTESWKLSLLMSGPLMIQSMKTEQRSVDFSDLKSVVERVLSSLGVRGVRILKPKSEQAGAAHSHFHPAFFHPGESAQVLLGNTPIGYFGSAHPRLATARGWKDKVWAAEFNWDLIKGLSRGASEFPKYKAWGEFPAMERDFALLVKKGTSADQITQSAIKSGRPLAKVATIFDVYEGSNLPEGMTSVAVRVIFSDEARSIKEEETVTASAKIIEGFKKDLGAELRT